MIRISNQLTATFSLGVNAGADDFIDTTNLENFTIYICAGNVAPEIELTFRLEDPSIVPLITTGNILTVMFGDTSTNLSDLMMFKLTGDNSNFTAGIGVACTITGRLYRPVFLDQARSASYTGSSVSVMQSIASRGGFNLVTNVGRTADQQTWYQEDITDCGLADLVWKHSFISSDTFLVFGFDFNNMYFYDMKQWAKTSYHWILTQTSGGTNTEVAIDSYICKNEYGIYAPYINNNTIIQTYNIDTQEVTNTTYKLVSFSSVGTNQLNINSGNTLSYEYTVRDNTVSPYYDAAYYQNVKNNMLFSSTVVYVTTPLVYRKFKLFDVCRMQVGNGDPRMSGKFYITGIAYQFTENRILTNLTLNAEVTSFINGQMNHQVS